ncbi:hypothetical protein BT69DRAFT_1232434, partial [Atractiella rhizophila]
EQAIAFDVSERGLLKRMYTNPQIIPTVPHEPWQEKPIPIPIALKPAVIKLIRERIRTGLYEPAASPYSSSWFVVEKTNGKI